MTATVDRPRLALVTTITASGVVFLDSTVVTIALPQMADQLGGGFQTQQWVVDGYLLTLGALVLVGGALGDRYGVRRIFELGLVTFAITSLLVGLAPSAWVVVLARLLQGVAAALLVPGSLAILSSLFSGAERGRAIGAWSGWTGVFIAVGPFLAGLLVGASDSGWRIVFLINLPIIAVALILSRLSIPDLAGQRSGTLDVAGAALATVGLALLVYPLIEVRSLSSAAVVGLVLLGAVTLAAFAFVERRVRAPMLPLGLFRVRSFAVANIVTIAIYGGLTVFLFLFVVTLQEAAGWSPLAAGAAGLPVTLGLLLLSPRVGALVPKVGARVLLSTGGLLCGAGQLLLLRMSVEPDYLWEILPALLVFGAGLVLVVAPITTTVLSEVEPALAGTASGVNNAVARVAGLVAVAAIPIAAGLSSIDERTPAALTEGFHSAMTWSAGLCIIGGLIAWVGLPKMPLETRVAPALDQPA